jgi:predicted metal-dependent peptidase
MSGSIGEELKAFFSEIVVIGDEVQPESIDILYWDGEVGGHEVYEGDYSSILNTTKPVGGGGTAPSCVSKYIKDKELEYELVIMFTDGYVGNDWGGNWQSPVLWVVVNNESASSSTGKTIHLKGD